jgi:hypothetical protein
VKTARVRIIFILLLLRIDCSFCAVNEYWVLV